MSGEPTTDNTTAQPPDAHDTRRAELTNALVSGKLSDQDRVAHLTELRHLVNGTTPEAPKAETRQQQLTRELIARQLSDRERSEKLRELKQLIAAGETAEERQARGELSLEDRRATYGVEDPRLPRPWAEQYAEEFSSWEVPLHDLAHEHGLAADQVRGLRDAALELGQVVGDTGRPASEGDLKKVFDKYRVAPSTRPALLNLWRRIEGGGAS